jgi:hypothetical protein
MFSLSPPPGYPSKYLHIWTPHSFFISITLGLNYWKNLHWPLPFHFALAIHSFISICSPHDSLSGNMSLLYLNLQQLAIYFMVKCNFLPWSTISKMAVAQITSHTCPGPLFTLFSGLQSPWCFSLPNSTLFFCLAAFIYFVSSQGNTFHILIHSLNPLILQISVHYHCPWETSSLLWPLLPHQQISSSCSSLS